MKNSIRSIIAAFSLFLFTQIGQAAEVSDAAVDWSGFYAGFNAGWGGSSYDLSPTCTEPGGVVNGPSCQNVPSRSLVASGLIGGAQVGYNRQLDQYIFGIEIDFQGTDINGSRTIDGPFQTFSGATSLPAAQYVAAERLKWFSTARLKLGRAISDRTIIYGTGGLAVGRYDLATNFMSSFFSYPGTKSVTKVGWTLGGGIERSFSRNGTIKLEALYFDLGEEKLSAGCAPGCGAGAVGYIRGTTFDLRGAIVRVGINWALDSARVRGSR